MLRNTDHVTKDGTISSVPSLDVETYFVNFSAFISSSTNRNGATAATSCKTFFTSMLLTRIKIFDRNTTVTLTLADPGAEFEGHINQSINQSINHRFVFITRP